MQGRQALRSIASFIAAGLLAGAAAADTTGDAVAAAGGTDFSVRAANAIQTTCRDLVFQNMPQNGGLENSQQRDLLGRCGDMVQTTLSVVGGNTAAENRYGLTSNAEVYATLRQFSGEEASTQGRFVTEGTTGQQAAVSSRLSAIRSGARVSGIALNVGGMPVMTASADRANSLPRLVGGNAGEAEGDVGFAWFGNVDYGWGDRDASDNENEYDADSYGVTLGLDYAFANGLVLGLAAGYHEDEIDFDAAELSALVDPVSGGGMDIDTWSVSGFFDFRNGPNYLSGIATYGASDYDMERFVIVPGSTAGAAPQNRRIISDTDADQYAISVQFGRTFGQAATTFDVYGGFQALDVDIDDYVETDLDGGSLALAFDDQTIESRQWILGGTLRHAISTGAGVLVPYASAEWHREIDNDATTVDARYALALGDVNGDGQSDNFALPTDDPDEDFFEVSVGIAGTLPNNIVVYFEYNGLVGLEDTTANVLTLGLRGTF